MSCMKTAQELTEPTATDLAAIVYALPHLTWCNAELTGPKAPERCQSPKTHGLLCARHDKVARNRMAKAVSGRRRPEYKDLIQQHTVTAADLVELVADAPHHHGVTVRLRSATVAMFQLRGLHLQENGSVSMSIGHCLNNARYSGGIYTPFATGHLIDVGLTAWSDPHLRRGVAERALIVQDIFHTRVEDLKEAARG